MHWPEIRIAHPKQWLIIEALGEVMQFVLKDNLPFTTVVIGYKGSEVEVTNVLIDTGSASSIFSADIVEQIQIVPSPQDTLQVIRGIGGTEVVFKRRVDFLNIIHCSSFAPFSGLYIAANFFIVGWALPTRI